MKPVTRTFYTLKDRGSRAFIGYHFVCDAAMTQTKRQAVALRKKTDGGTEVVRVEVKITEASE